MAKALGILAVILLLIPLLVVAVAGGPRPLPTQFYCSRPPDPNYTFPPNCIGG